MTADCYLNVEIEQSRELANMCADVDFNVGINTTCWNDKYRELSNKIADD